MIKGLRVTMILWGAVNILVGLAFILAPQPLLAMDGFEEGPAYFSYFLAYLGNALLVSGAMMLIAARDPLQHIMWVQLAVAWSLLDALAALYFLIHGTVHFSQMGWIPIIDALFVLAFLVLYPRHNARADWMEHGDRQALRREE